MFLRLLFLLPALSPAQTTKQQIEALDKQWASAILARDAKTLDRILSPDLLYGHASGVVDTKQDYLDKISSGRQVYKSLDQKGVIVKLHGDTAVTQSWVRVTGVNPQGPFDDKIMMQHVWKNVRGNWLLIAHQTAKVDKLP